jgi:AcrR family transcriptional regulator
MKKNSKDPVAHNEQIKKNRKAAKNPAKRLAIIKAAERVFARKGFHETPIADVAKEAHVSEATIYEYFLSKEDLLFSIPAEAIRKYRDKNLEMLPYIKGAADKLRAIIKRHLSLYADNSDYANVVMLILKGNRNFVKTEAYKIVQSAARITTQVLEEGIRTGEFRSDLQPHLARAMIWGTIEHLVIRKGLLGRPDDLLALADEITRTILNGIENPSKNPDMQINVTVEHKNS